MLHSLECLMNVIEDNYAVCLLLFPTQISNAKKFHTCNIFFRKKYKLKIEKWNLCEQTSRKSILTDFVLLLTCETEEISSHFNSAFIPAFHNIEFFESNHMPFLYLPTILAKKFQTNSSFCVKWRSMEKIPFLFFKNFLLVLVKF